MWDQLGVVFNKFSALEKSPRDFGSGDKLFPSEIHVIEAIGKHPGINMTELASVLGISKPAVSQILRKVMRKNLVERYTGVRNGKEVLARLTGRGEIAFRGHAKLHARTDAVLMERLRRVTSQEVDFLVELFKEVALYFDQVTNERKPEVSFNQSRFKKRGKT